MKTPPHARLGKRACRFSLNSLVWAVCLTAGAASLAAGPRVYFGTYDGPESRGIYVSDWNGETGDLGEPQLAVEAKSPSFLALTPDRQYVVAVNESGTDGQPTGAVTLFKIDAESGRLEKINEQPVQGAGPCHVAVSPDGGMVVVANYGSGSVASYTLADGKLSPPVSTIQHEGRSLRDDRQKGPHAHSGTFSPDGKFVFFCDLGVDKIFGHHAFPKLGTLEAAAPPFTALKGGSGPRHFAFHPEGKTAYVINELANTLATLNYDAATGRLEVAQTTNTLPADFSGRSSTAHVAVHPSGKWVYGSNRGHNSIARFAIDPSTGWTRFIDAASSGGKIPRHFALDAEGKWLLAANQDSGNVVVFRLAAATGALIPTGKSAAVGKPVCVVFWTP